jgi:hypothetical protein
MTEALAGGCFCGAVRFEVEGPSEIDLTLNSLDDPSRPVLKAHIWVEDKAPWFDIGDDLPVREKNIG